MSVTHKKIAEAAGVKPEELLTHELFLYSSQPANGGVPVIPPEGSAAGEEPTPTPDTSDNLLMERLVSFFTFWVWF